MISLFKIENTRLRGNDEFVSVELRGLSTDEKPTEINGKKVDNGSAYIEIDTSNIHFYDLESEEWK